MNEEQKLHFEGMLVWLAFLIVALLGFLLPTVPFLFVKVLALPTFLISYVMFWANGYFYFKKKKSSHDPTTK